MPELPTSSFRLPSGETVDVAIVKTDGGKLVPRRPDEVINRPTPPPARP